MMWGWGRGGGKIEVLSLNLAGKKEENHEEPQS